MTPTDLLRLIRDLQEPCICPDRRGHTDHACPWYDLPTRAEAAAKDAHEAAMARLAR